MGAIGLPMRKITASSQSRTSNLDRFRTAVGQVMVLICLAMVAILGLIGVVADVGTLQAQKQSMQTAADSAALAAAQESTYGDTVAAGKADAASNGFTDGANSVAVSINNPPTSGPNAGTSGYLEAVVKSPEPTYFLRVLGFSSINMSARAVA